MKKLILSLLLSLPLLAQAQVSCEYTELDSIISFYVDHDKVIGAFGIMEEGRITYQKAYAGTDASLPKVTTTTLYRIGSITKTFTAVLVLKLVEEGKLHLDDKLALYFPDIKNAKKITLRHLLNHRSGIKNFTDDDDYWSYYQSSQSKNAMLQRFNKLGSDFKPGSATSYSNTGFVLLGYIVEQASGLTYEEALAQYITKPLGLANTVTAKAAPTDGSKEARSYSPTASNDKPWSETEYSAMDITGGAGSIISTPADLLTFIYGLMKGKLVSKEHLELMKEQKEGIGAGLIAFPWNEYTAYGHTGGIDGYSSVLLYIPAHQIAYCALTNGLNMALNDIAVATLRSCYGKSYELEVKDEEAVDVKVLERYPGQYESKDLPLPITITLVDGVLMAQAKGQSAFPLTASSETSFFYEAAKLEMNFEKKNNSWTFNLLQGGGSFKYTLTK